MVLCLRRFVAVLLLTGWAGLVACSSSPSASSTEREPSTAPQSVAAADDAPVIAEGTAAQEPTTSPEAIAGDDAPVIAEGTAAVEPTTSPESASGEEPVEPRKPRATPEPLRPAGEPQPTTADIVSPNNAFIARVSMTATSIEVGWSDREGGAEFHIHRVVRTSNDEPGVEVMTAENLIHVGGGLARFVDEGVEPGTKYWHGVRVLSAEGDVIAHGWHRTAAVDDLEPPAAPDGIIAFIENGEVRVIWATPDENYQLHSYQVFRGVDGEPPEQISATWRLDQLSFIDDDPPAGQLVYQIRALDFHWNLSEPGGVTINFP